MTSDRVCGRERVSKAGTFISGLVQRGADPVAEIACRDPLPTVGQHHTAELRRHLHVLSRLMGAGHGTQRHSVHQAAMLPEFLQNSRLKVWAQRMSGGGRSKPAKKPPAPRTPASPRRVPSAPASATSTSTAAAAAERPSNYRSVRYYRQTAAAAAPTATPATNGMKPTHRQTINLNRARVSVLRVWHAEPPWISSRVRRERS